MAYQNPALVKSPKNCLSDLKVIYDGKEENEEAYANDGGWSLASLKWYGNLSMGVRWNGNEERPVGIPQSRGYQHGLFFP